MFNLLRYFSLASLVSMVAASLLLGAVYRQIAVADLVDIAQDYNVDITRAFSNTVWHEFAPFLDQASRLSTETLRSHPETARLDRAIRDYAKDISVAKVKIYDLGGRTLFSTEPGQIGADQSLNPAIGAARAGRISSELVHRGSFSAFHRVIEDRDLLSSYIPVYRGGKPEAVFELYHDITPFVRKVAGTQQKVVVIVLLVFTALYGVLFFIVRRADRLLKLQAERAREDAEALHRSRQELKALAENAPDVIVRYDREARQSFVNPAITIATGRMPEDFAGRTVAESGYPAPLAEALAGAIRGVFESGRQRNLEFALEGPLGARHFESRLVPEFGLDGGVESVLGVSRDITERRRAQAELAASHEKLRQLALRLESAREAERARIAREIHDELGATLTNIKMDLGWCTSRREQSDHCPIERVKAATELVDSAIRTVRRIATDLRPSILDHLGLWAAIEWLAQEFEERTGIPCELQLPAADAALGSEQAIALFRIVQEALTNVSRHAGASTLRIRAALADHQLSLEVADDGAGITEAQLARADACGILGMKERARQFGGAVEVAGVSGQGTRVTVRLPLPAPGASHER